MMQPLNGAIESAKNILLQHPLSIATDARLVSTCDLLTRQGSFLVVHLAHPADLGVLLGVIHEELEKREEIGDDHSMFEAVQHATKSIDDWLEEWDVRMGTKISIRRCSGLFLTLFPYQVPLHSQLEVSSGHQHPFNALTRIYSIPALR